MAVSPEPSSPRPLVLCLSGTFATDRILMYSSLAGRLTRDAALSVWSYGPLESGFPSTHPVGRLFERLPSEEPGAYRFALARRFDAFLWDHAGLSRSRESAWHLRLKTSAPFHDRVMRASARLLPGATTRQFFERRLEQIYIRHGYNRTAKKQLEAARPALVVAMNPWNPLQIAIVAAARQLAIPVVAFITSFDNITTKGRLVFEYDAYITWSKHMSSELQTFYPQSRGRPHYVVGAPQFDVFEDPAYRMPRAEWCRTLGLDPARPLVVYCLGSPNLIKEEYGFAEFLERLRSSGIQPAPQVILRLHPGFHESGYALLGEIISRNSDVIVQRAVKNSERVAFQKEQDIREWVNTVAHANVIVNLASTMTVDASICDTPVVGLDFDPEPGQPNQQLIKQFYRAWNHFTPLAETGGLWLSGSSAETVHAVREYLRAPELHAEGRRRIVGHVCGEVDGRAGSRMAEALLQMCSTPEARMAVAAGSTAA